MVLVAKWVEGQLQERAAVANLQEIELAVLPGYWSAATLGRGNLVESQREPRAGGRYSLLMHLTTILPGFCFSGHSRPAS